MWRFTFISFLLICHGSLAAYVYETSLVDPKIVLVTADDSGKILPGSPLTLKIDDDHWMFGMVSKMDDNGEPIFTYFDDAQCEYFKKLDVECRPSHEPGKYYIKLYNPDKDAKNVKNAKNEL